MREGLFWTSANNVPDLEYYKTDCPKGSTFPVSREYIIREFPNRPKNQSRWVGEVTISSKSKKTLSNFRLDNILAQNVHYVGAWDKNERYLYFSKYRFPDETIWTCDGNLPPLNGHW